MADLLCNWPFCSKDLMTLSEHKKADDLSICYHIKVLVFVARTIISSGFSPSRNTQNCYKMHELTST